RRPVSVSPRHLSSSRPSATRLQPLLNFRPIDIREESFDVLRSFSWFVIQQKRVLPNVHHQDWIEACDVASFMQRNPVIRNSSVRRVLIADGPTYTAHLADANEVSLPNLVTSKRGFRSLGKLRCFVWIARTATLRL